MKRVLDRAWALTDKAEHAGDHRGAIVALREVRESLEALNTLLVRVGSGPNGAALEVRVTFIGVRERAGV